MELDFHGVRTYWNWGSMALCRRERAQHAPHERACAPPAPPGA